jgi:hypothetical protein
VWSSGIQRLSGVDVDRLNAVLCCCLTTTVGTNASMTLIARATAAQMVDIIGALILDSILNSRQLHPTLLPGCFSSYAVCRRSACQCHVKVHGCSCSWSSSSVGALCQRQSSRHIWLEGDLDTWIKID